MSDSNKTGANSQYQQSNTVAPATPLPTSQTIKPIPSGKLRVKFQTIDHHLQAVSKIIGKDLDSPEQFLLWGVISQMQDLFEHYDELADQDFHNSEMGKGLAEFVEQQGAAS